MNLARPNLEKPGKPPSVPGRALSAGRRGSRRPADRQFPRRPAQGCAQEPDLPHPAHRPGAYQRQACQADTRIAAGDQVRIPPVRMGDPRESGAPPTAQIEEVEQAIIFEDRDFLVLDKPSGVASHGGSGINVRRDRTAARRAAGRYAGTCAPTRPRYQRHARFCAPAPGPDRPAGSDPRQRHDQAVSGPAQGTHAQGEIRRQRVRCASRSCRAASAWCASPTTASRR